MSDRERLEEIAYKVINERKETCGETIRCRECKYINEEDCNVAAFIDKLLEQGFTFKKKREYIRKSPCKCGASNRCVDLHRRFGVAYYQCRKCGARVKSFFTEKSARIEWNKMNEVKNEN